MKSKCSFILKASLALVLTMLMVFGSVSTVLAAAVDLAGADGGALLAAAKKGGEIASTGANADLAETGATTIYFKNTLNWSNVYAYIPEGWNNNGCYNTGTGTLMSKVSGTKDLYSCSVDYTDRIAFTNAVMDNFGNFYGNSAAYSTSFNSKYPVYYPGTTYKTVNTTTYYNEDCSAFWIAYDVKLYGDSSFATGWNTSSTATMSIDATTGYYKYSFTPSSARTEWFRILFGGSEKYCPNSGSDTVIGGTDNKQLYKYGESGAFKFSSDTSHRYTIWMDLVDKKVWYTSEAVSTTYTGVTAVAKGSNDGSTYDQSLGTIQSGTSVNSSTGLSVTAGSYSNYQFVKWVASGSGTFANANSASTTFYPAANSEIATAQYKRTYSVTKNTPSNGTITLSKSSDILAGQTFKVTLAPSSGYRVATFTVGGVDKKSSLNSSNEYTHTCTGATSSIAVNATFEAIPGTTIYIKKTMPTFSYIHLWNGANTTNISDAGQWPGDQFTSWSQTSDSKYYYKTYTWDCATFKFILNNNNDKQTSDSAAYNTGTSYYIDTAEASSAGVLTEGVPSAKAITYTSTFATSDVTWGGTKPATAYPGETVSFTVSAKSGYRLTGVKYNDGSDHTLTASSGTYSFTMPSSAVTVTATTVKTYQVSLTVGSGVATRQYKLGSSGTYADYSSSLTVDSGTDVYFKVTYSTGYEYASNSGLTVVTANTEFRTGSVTSAKSVTINTQKITWSGLTAVAKYSKTGASGSYTNTDFATAPTITIAATSATQLDGVAVTAPGTDPTGYVWAGWYTANGSFANAQNKDTTFKPNAANAQAVATYKKIYTITSSVDSTGTGAGTVSTSVTSVVAGGSYTVTAAATGSYSEIESITVNGTNKGSNASTTVSGVSANQTVVAKFKSKVYLKGTMNSTHWAGDVMSANSAGTAYTIANVELSANTTYEFRHYVDSDTWSSEVSTWTLNNLATHSTNGDNLTITTSDADIKVTFVSDGTKFTSITAIPASSTTYNVTLTYNANYTITVDDYLGVEYTTAGKSANVTVPVYSGTSISYTVTAASGKYLSTVTVGGTQVSGFSACDSYDGSISNVTSAKTIAATASNKFAITAKSNKSARGTVSVSPTSARPGETVTITVSPKSGVLSTLTVSYAGGNTYTRNFTTNSWDLVTAGTGAAAPASVGKNIALAAVGAESEITGVGADPTYTFDLDSNPTGALSVNATFAAYSAESDWYYNGYDTSGNALSGYHSQQMTEGMIGGETFSYYHVEGRSGSDQLFTVTDGSTANYGKVYFTCPGSWTKLHVYFFDGVSWNWPGDTMTSEGNGNYSYTIPTGAKKVIFNNGDNSYQTTDIDLTSTSGAYYVSSGETSTSASVSEWASTPSDAGISTGTEYFYSNSIYVDNFYSGGFNNHNTNSKNYIKPKGGNGVSWGSSEQGDYYIVVLYPGTTYTIDYNGHTTTNTVPSGEPYVIWMTELPSDDDSVKIYAKDGAIRSESYGSTYANIADTKIYASDGSTTVGTQHSGGITNQTYETYNAGAGDTVVIKTQIGATDDGTLSDSADLIAKYYVRGFCINGEVTQLLEWNSSGLYTLTYKVPEDDEDLKKVEITPIYYLKDTETYPIVTYRVTGFTDTLKEVGSGKPNWGDTLYTYPFYGKLGSQNNALGAYPGQPMVYYKGQYTMQIPQKSTAWDIYYDDGALSSYSGNTAKADAVHNMSVSGVTMSNGYYDLVHRQIMGYGDNSASADHVQTYDYGDFYKIFNEKAPVDNIVFDFKYETTNHNLETNDPASPTPANLTSTYTNGFELLTNFHGRHVDLFGTALSGDAADPEVTKPLYVVSIGGVNGSNGVENIAGYYATEWKVFAPTTTLGTPSSSDAYSLVTNGKSSIPPEVLVLNDDDTTSFNTTTYPSAVANHSITDWEALYTTLEAYRGRPVLISYEAADAQIGSGNYNTSGSGGATRNDGRWLYSKNGETITSTIKIQYSDDNGATYTDLNTTTPQVSGLSAYFTNDGVEGETTYTTTIDPDKTFDMEAKTTNGNYKFVGWFMEDGTKITTDNATHTERSGSYTFIAKFMLVTDGQLILSHSSDTGTISGTTYSGAGTSKIGVVVKDGDETVRTYDLSTSDVTLDDKIIKSDSTYTIYVTLEATATGNDNYGATVLATPSGQDAKFYNIDTQTTVDKTKTIVLDSFNVSDLYTGTTQNYNSIIYHSYYVKAVFHYNLKFEYTDRDGVTKNFYRDGYLSATQAANEEYVEKVTVSGYSTRYLRPAFIETVAPYVSNFGEEITWNLADRVFAFTVEDNYYNCEHFITAVQTGSDTRTVTFSLPYAHTNGIATGGNSGTKATTTNFVLDDVTFKSVPELPNNATNGIYDGQDTRENWIAAPAEIYDSSADETLYFQYWSVKNTSAAGEDDPEVARCYFQGFNFAVLDNYTVTAVYDDEPTDISSSGIYTGATYLETSRNQWNDNQDRAASAKNASNVRYAADLLYNDFILHYNFKGAEIKNNGEDVSAIQELGVVVERIRELDINQDGTKNTTISNYTSSAENLDTVRAVINGTSSDKKYYKNTVAKTSLDNKNRIMFYDAFYNGAGWSMDDQTSVAKYTYKNYVYRAYTYIKYTDDQNNTQIVLSEAPAYFTMYDEAVADYQ